MESDPRTWIAALENSQRRLDGLVRSLSPDQVLGQSYCADWTVAALLSHLGSGAEISAMMLESALGRTGPVGREQFQPVWDRWDAMSPDEQASGVLAADAVYLAALRGLTDEDLARAEFEFLGMTLDAVGLVRLRLGEHALHVWDLAVMQDAGALVAPDAVRLLIEMLPGFAVPRFGRPQGTPLRARIMVTGPDRTYLLAATDAVSLTEVTASGIENGFADADGAVAEIAMPAEALLRLVYGRLDAAHTPDEVQAKPADLDLLRAIFPGF
ncbi:MAG: maleylpyruvate isomerase N-terminal domain-containing protein [Streptosporangiaceae bacterium]